MVNQIILISYMFYQDLYSLISFDWEVKSFSIIFSEAPGIGWQLQVMTEMAALHENSAVFLGVFFILPRSINNLDHNPGLKIGCRGAPE